MSHRFEKYNMIFFFSPEKNIILGTHTFSFTKSSFCLARVFSFSSYVHRDSRRNVTNN